MRILFLCSSLEPGRDGVGDHVRTLAEACERQGHTCALMALHDPHSYKVTESFAQGEIRSLRIAALVDPPPDHAAAVEFRRRFAPDWISLHLVAYGLNPRGILYGAIPMLREIIADTPLQLMLHELWLGNDQAPSWRHRIMGFFQRASLRKLMAVLRPRLVATSNPLYAALLGTIGVEAEILPLFGNIAIASDPPLPPSLEEAGLTSRTRDEWWLGLFFGGLYPEWRAEPFFSLLARAAGRAGKRVCLVLAGNAGNAGENIWRGLAQDYSRSFHFLRLRSQPAADLSALLQAADFGVAASPWSVIGKSGSVAAMLDHGLPVIVTRDDFQPRVSVALPPSSDPLLHRCDEALEAKLAAGLPRRFPSARVDGIAGIFLRQLAEAGNSSLQASGVSA